MLIHSATATADATDIHPIETPLVLSGFSPDAVKFFQDHVSIMGLMPVAGLGGSAPEGSVTAHMRMLGLRCSPAQR